MTWKPPLGHWGQRPADTYRGARRNAARRKAISAKEHRLSLGLSRAEYDEMRRVAAEAKKLAQAMASVRDAARAMAAAGKADSKEKAA